MSFYGEEGGRKVHQYTSTQVHKYPSTQIDTSCSGDYKQETGTTLIPSTFNLDWSAKAEARLPIQALSDDLMEDDRK